MVCGLALDCPISRFEKNDWHNGEKSKVGFIRRLLSTELRCVYWRLPLTPACYPNTNTSRSHSRVRDRWTTPACGGLSAHRSDTSEEASGWQSDAGSHASVAHAAHPVCGCRSAVKARGRFYPDSLWSTWSHGWSRRSGTRDTD